MTTVLRRIDLGEVGPIVTVDGDRVDITGLTVLDPDLAGLLAATPEESRPDLVRRVLTVGARGLATMGIGLDLAAVDERIHHTLAALTDEAERRLAGVLEQGRSAMQAQFDPELRSSVVSRLVAEFTEWRDTFLGRIDPAREGSHTTEFLARLAAVVGPDGHLEQRIAAALDPSSDGSALGALLGTIEERFGDLRDLIIRERGVDAGRSAEAARGTAQGLDYEDGIETVLRRWAASIGGCVVERVGRTPGDLGPQATVGDFVVTFPDGYRIVIEAKNQATVGLAGRDGILGELDRAMANRGASASIAVSCREAFPAEVGRFGVYGPRVLVVDEGDGVMLQVALHWARARAQAEAAGRRPQLDTAAVAERVASIRRLAEGLSSSRTALTKIRDGVDMLHGRLGEMRAELLEQVAEVERALGEAG
ncbi:MAG TPA: hypothetical protein VFY15_05310 [Acidimicrobiia bacterium]|nr:hypothetical protein [Acidimicrobiia bacterium]